MSLTLTIVLILAVNAWATGTIYYVSATGDGDGSSWQEASADFSAMLQKAVAGDTIWVAAGTYLPTSTDDRSASFLIPDGVAIFGGFAGTETSLEERNWQLNETILSGELGDQDDQNDNSYTIVVFEAVSGATILDGFFLQNGAANGFAEGADMTVAGAAIFNNAKDKVSSPTISNCVFRNNHAREGAAIYNYAEGGDCSPQITNCKFTNNKADFNGGAIFNNGDYGTCNPHIIECDFESNWSVYGAGILNSGYEGECKPLVTKSVFIDNYSAVRGAAIYNLQEGSGIIDPILVANRFEDNNSTVGGDVEGSNNTTTVANNDKATKSGTIQLRKKASSVAY